MGGPLTAGAGSRLFELPRMPPSDQCPEFWRSSSAIRLKVDKRSTIQA